MLYREDTKDPHKLTSLLSWLDTQAADESYTYYSQCNCLLSQYYKAKGFMFVKMWNTSFRHGFFKYKNLPKHFDAIASAEPHTFGAARQRAVNTYFNQEVL